MATARRVRERDRGLTPVAALLGLAAVAWALSAERMAGMDMGPGTALGGLPWFLVTWVVMMAAMMLPSLTAAVRASGEGAPFVAGYLSVWTGAGLAAYAVIEGVRSAGVDWLAWDRAGRYVAAGAILAAAAYQLTRAKSACLHHCRTPARRASGGRSGSAGVRAGLRYGAACVGCCAGLMAALFALGAMSLVWMAAVAALIAAERLLPWPVPAVYGVAAVLAVLAVFMAVDPAGLPGLTLPGSMGM
jgi:predicted metal-binding membrane protein